MSGGVAHWVLGFFLGVAAGLMVLFGGAALLVVAIASLALAFVAVRSLAFLSGAFAGAGAAWLALVLRAQLACDALDAAPNRGCQGFGVEPFLAVSAAVLIVGLFAGARAWRASLRA